MLVILLLFIRIRNAGAVTPPVDCYFNPRASGSVQVYPLA
jgi:hypothetical protein